MGSLPALPISSFLSCPAGVTGIPVFQDCSGDKCEPRICRYDGQLYEKGCTFIPDIQQNTSFSVMYLQLPSVSITIPFWTESLVTFGV